jgi:hypothetical protein
MVKDHIRLYRGGIRDLVMEVACALTSASASAPGHRSPKSG